MDTLAPYTYLALHIFTLLGPLPMSWHPRLQYARRWPQLLPALLLPAILFIVWDAFFTHWGVWGFNAQYVTGLVVAGLPIEEWAFFFTIPFSCIFIADVLELTRPLRTGPRLAAALWWLCLLGALVLLAVGWPRLYPSATAVVLLVALLLHRLLLGLALWPHVLRSWAVCFLPFFVVNGVLTALPVVWYNDAENLGFRIYTIPFEDYFYGMALYVLNMTLYKWLLRKRKGTYLLAQLLPTSGRQ